ncbi:MAG: SufD family Fe-S cluster assembly protein [Candidatus Sungbacteria bacterium]|nr:SufD family Fe-S cluster assembly protein [Candidatus Sungbacteria bacterium]
MTATAVKKGEERAIQIDPSSTEEDLEIEEGGSATVFIANNPKLTFSAKLSGRGAALNVIGRLRGIGDMRQEITLKAILQAPDTRCRVDMRTALADTSASFFDGLIRMEEGAKNAEGHLSYRALLMSPGARAKPIPRLEILTREVASAGHAASVGKIDEEQLFYLQSRGLSRKEAEALIVEGFLAISKMA